MIASVIMCTLNGMPCIQKALDSAREQTLSDIEILVIDPGSTDGTLEYIKKCAAEDPRVKYISSDRADLGHQLNLGLRSVAGEYFTILDQDDYLDKDFLRLTYEVARKDPEIDLVASDFYVFCETKLGRYSTVGHYLTKDFRDIEQPVTNKGTLFKINGNTVHYFAALYRTSFFSEHSILAREVTTGGADMDIWFQRALFNQKEYYLQIPLYYFQINSSVSNSAKEWAVSRPNSMIISMLTYCLGVLDRNPDRKLLGIRWLVDELVPALFAWVGQDLYYGKTLRYEDELKALRKYLLAYMEDLPTNCRARLADNMHLQMLLYSAEVFQEMARRHFGERRTNLCDVLRAVEKENKAIIFGKGFSGKRLYDFLYGNLYCNGYEGEIVFCANSVPQGQVQEVRGVPAYSVLDAVSAYPDALYLVPEGEYTNEMLEQLRILSVSPDRIQITRMMNGFEIFEDLRGEERLRVATEQ